MKQFQMGLATQSSIGIGIMGIGYTDSEANVFSGNGTQYPNLVDALVSAGLAPTQAYSLWLNDLGKSYKQWTAGNLSSNKLQTRVLVQSFSGALTPRNSREISSLST